MRYALILLLAFYSSALKAQQLSDNAQISILTVGPGTSLNDAFGHSAFRIKDRTIGLDIVYGYGEYDFDAPNFYLKFAQGKLNYLISKTDFNRFYRIYEYFNRSIDEQVLNLNASEKQKLYAYLQNNYKPENRRYLYDFLFDNCATKIKDVTDIATTKPITFQTPKDYKEATFRTLIQENLNRNSWGSLGIDVALGAIIDRTATPEQHMFLPKNIFSFFEVAKKGNGEPLVVKSKTVFSSKPQKTASNFLYSPLFIFGVIGFIILFITYKDFKLQRRTKTLDIILFSLTGLAGIIVFLLWFATDHQATKNNYNLLWANPLNILVLFQVLKQKLPNWTNKYFKFLVILLCLLVFHWATGVQVFAIGLIPFLIALCVRYIYLIHYSKKPEFD